MKGVWFYIKNKKLYIFKTFISCLAISLLTIFAQLISSKSNNLNATNSKI